MLWCFRIDLLEADRWVERGGEGGFVGRGWRKGMGRGSCVFVREWGRVEGGVLGKGEERGKSREREGGGERGGGEGG